MRKKYNFNLFFVQGATVMFIVNIVAAGLLEKLKEKTSTGK